MRRCNLRHGFSLNEILLAITVVGCIVSLIVGLFNYSSLGIKNDEIKQAKLENLLKSVSKAILSQEKILNITQACDPIAMRNIYLKRFGSSAKETTIAVNGKTLPAIKIANLGIIAFDVKDTCELDWNASTKSSMAKGGSLKSAKTTPTNTEKDKTTSTDTEKNKDINKEDTNEKDINEEDTNADNTDITSEPPVKIFATTNTDAEEIVVPEDVTANSSKTTSNKSSFLTSNTLAFNMNASGLNNTYISTSNSNNNTLATSNSNNSTSISHDINICYAKENYSYISTKCFDQNGQGIDVKYLEMLDETTCEVSFCPGNGYDKDGNLIAAGKINLLCKVGNGNVGQCACPAGKEFWASQYISENSSITGICLSDCSELNMVETFTGSRVCTCPDGTVWDRESNKCITPGVCPEDYLKWDYSLNKCICKTEIELIQMNPDYFEVCEIYDSTKVTEECKRLGENWEMYQGICVCPVPYVADDKECSCEAPFVIDNNGQCSCPFPTELDGSICVCPSVQPNGMTFGKYEKYDATNPLTCKSCDTVNTNRIYANSVSNECVCKPKSQIALAANQIYDTTQTNCIYTCKDGAVANANHTECVGACLEEYDYTTETLNCIQNPTASKIKECLTGGNAISDPTAVTCKVECAGLTSPNAEYNACVCDNAKVTAELSKPENADKIYDMDNAPSCLYTCKDGAVANANHTECVGACLEEYNYTTETLNCIQNPTASKIKECLTGGNAISDPTAATCKVECAGLTSPNAEYNACVCDNAKVTAELSKPENANKIYDMDNAPLCMAACTGQTIVSNDRLSCEPVGCLYKTDDNVTKYCNPNPTDEETTRCLANTNFVSDPTAATCKVECTGLTSPNAAHKACPCDATKVTEALNLPQNANKIYDMGNAPVCMATCTGQTIVSKNRLSCEPVGCLYKTDDNVTKYCNPNPTDEETTRCLANTNFVSDPTAATCKVECTGLTSPNAAHKACPCDSVKVTEALNLPQNANKIYDMSNAPVCMATCTGQTIVANNRLSCEPVGCLYKTDDNVTKYCNPNPTDEETARCLANTNFVSDPTAATCKVECTGLTSPNAEYNACVCDNAKVTAELSKPGNANKIYDMDNAPFCMATCTGQTIVSSDRLSCEPVGCLYRTDDNVTKYCNPNPTDAEVERCLANTNYIYDPSKAICKIPCTGLTSPDNEHRECICDNKKVTNALNKPENANKIYDMDNAPLCMATCTGQTIVSKNRLSCEPVGCLYKTDDNVTKYCNPNPTDAETTRCLANTNYVSDPSAVSCKVECTGLTSPNAVHKACPCDGVKVTEALNLPQNASKIYDMSNAPVCMATCTGQTIVSKDRLSCDPVGCLYKTDNNVTKYCNPNPTNEETTRCLANTNYISDPSAVSCKVECAGLTSPDNVYKECACDNKKVTDALNKPENANKIYDMDNAPLCMAACTGQTIVSKDRLSCEPVGCLYTTDDNVTKYCNPNPTDAEVERCLANTNYIYDPSKAICKIPCTGLTSPDNEHRECICDNKKVTNALNKSENANKIYDMDNAPVCMAACTGQTIVSKDRLSCEPVGCLYKTDNNVTKYCNPNPTDAETTRCLANTNYISDPSKANCKVKCTGLTSPNNVHKQCPCDYNAVTAELNMPQNANKIYDMVNAPICIKECVGQTIVSNDRLSCDPVGCLYKTDDNVTKYCNPNPTDAETKRCLANTNYKSNPNLYLCRQDCGSRHVPNNVHKTCECDMVKMATQYSSSNMKFDATSSRCESPCPSVFTVRRADNPTVCECPLTKPSSVSVQAGYYYNANSTVLTGSYACQTKCPVLYDEVKNWIRANSQKFNNDKKVYNSTIAGCVGNCTGNYIADANKTACICPLNANSCPAGKYFKSSTCSCEPCPKGNYCPGSNYDPNPNKEPNASYPGAYKCPCGTYGATTGLTNYHCSGNCSAGYYCLSGSVMPTQIPCSKGYSCPAGSCQSTICQFPSTSVSPYVACDKCRSESEIKAAQPNFYSENEIWVDNLQKNCKACKSNMVYNASGICECPATMPYWNDLTSKCQKCKLWSKLYFARQEKDNPGCTLYNHMNGTNDGKCFTEKRIPDADMVKVASLLSSADKNRNFGNGIYAYMVAVSPDGKSASVVGVFTTRSWYHTFPDDLSSATVARSRQASGSCQEMCAGNQECVSTCNYMYGKISSNSMFSSCKYVVNNKWYGGSYDGGETDEYCAGGTISLTDGCSYSVGGLMRRVISPLVLDLKGDGYEYTSVGEGVIFDLDNDGTPDQTAWTKEQTEFDNAFLVLDKNKNGQVDNGGELFGDQNGAENGFKELEKYDDNADKVINKEDKVYTELLLWVDFNKNAKVDYEADGTTKELKTLEEAGVTEISTEYKVKKDKFGNILRDIYGNITGFMGSFKMMIQDAAGKLVEVIRSMMDVFFVTQ